MIKLTSPPLLQDDGSIKTEGYMDNVAARAVQLKSDKEGATNLIKLLQNSGTNWVASSPGYPPKPE